MTSHGFIWLQISYKKIIRPSILSDKTGLKGGSAILISHGLTYSSISTCMISHADWVTELPGPKIAATPAL